jgi:hypothetical protein
MIGSQRQCRTGPNLASAGSPSTVYPSQHGYVGVYREVQVQMLHPDLRQRTPPLTLVASLKEEEESSS